MTMDDVTQRQQYVNSAGAYQQPARPEYPTAQYQNEDDEIGQQYRPPVGQPPLNRAARRAYVRRPKTYRLQFDTADMAGLEVRARSLPLGRFMELIELATMFDGADLDKMSPEDAGGVRALFEGFAEALISWNVEEPVVDPATGEETGETVPVPATVEGLYRQDMEFAMVLIREWMDAVAAVGAPLPQGSPSGGPSLEASMPMDVRSPSPTS